MRISLLNGITAYHLAGQSGVVEAAHSSAADLSIEGDIAKQTARFVRADAARTWDRKNLATKIAFSTVRVFASVKAAEQWAADYDTAFPRSGTLILEPTATLRTLPAALFVAGALTSDGSTPVVFPVLRYAGLYNSLPCYSSDGTLPSGSPTYTAVLTCEIGDDWTLTDQATGEFWHVAQAVAHPGLITLPFAPWSPATGTPSLVPVWGDCRFLPEAVLDPPARQVRGCSVILRYTAIGGLLTDALPGTWSSEIPWPVGGNWEDS